MDKKIIFYLKKAKTEVANLLKFAKFVKIL